MRIQIWHIVVLVIAFVLLFGWKNLPNVSRSLGESMRVFKSEVDQMKDENEVRRSRSQDSGPPPGEARDEHGLRGDRAEDRSGATAREEHRQLPDGRPRVEGRDGRDPSV